ncbi:hypothetical protein ARMGADRAFT_194036 [Armillaria gallica]|uniref:Uncharacterized protein n=1 Tax=Armillaria gallica TaxID=47427 RepID=A0A2H3D9N1_ARMGA|nr:hypothetical protein ARMGADRAFT_194036 [Armillaria gallica]
MSRSTFFERHIETASCQTFGAIINTFTETIQTYLRCYRRGQKQEISHHDSHPGFSPYRSQFDTFSRGGAQSTSIVRLYTLSNRL